VRLVLDEHYSSQIAQQLRDRAHDVVAVTETELVEQSDDDVWSWMASEKRGLLTENVADFMPLVQRAAAGGEHHYGVIFSSPHSMPRSRATIGRFVEALEELLHRYPADDGLLDQVAWLS
jgi:hypothetical protein